MDQNQIIYISSVCDSVISICDQSVLLRNLKREIKKAKKYINGQNVCFYDNLINNINNEFNTFKNHYKYKKKLIEDLDFLISEINNMVIGKTILNDMF